MPFKVLLGRALRLRCVSCGQGRLFRGFLRMNPSCDRCGDTFRHEPGYYIGAIYFNYGVTASLGLTAGFLLLGHVDQAPLLAGLVTFAIVFPFLFFRHSRALWLAVERYFNGLSGAGDGI